MSRRRNQLVGRDASPGRSAPSQANLFAGKSQAVCQEAPQRIGATWSSGWVRFLAIVLISVSTAAVYSKSLHVPFFFDDDNSITANPTIRSLWPIWSTLSPPSNGEAVQRRPVVNLSLAINYAISGETVWSYHAFNVLAHTLAALVLFGVVRRTLLQPKFRDRWGSLSTPIAFVIGTLWAIHPLQTEAVTYVIQRTEVLAGLFYLLTLYCVIRSAESTHGMPWHVAAVFACMLAMGSKESAVSAPIVMLLYDRIFLSRTWSDVFRRRRFLYVGLAATWAVVLVMLPRGNEGTAILGEEGRSIHYALAQCRVILHYLRLCFWPHPLVVDYGLYEPQPWSQILPNFLAMIVLLATTGFALWRWPWAGFLGICFFAILAPSSSIVPLYQQIAAEKRIYLPSATVITLVVIGAVCLARWLAAKGFVSLHTCERMGAAILVAVVAALGITTITRIQDYRSIVSIWQDTVAKLPNNPRGQSNLGIAILAVNHPDQAMVRGWKAAENQLHLADRTGDQTNGPLYGGNEAALKYCSRAVELNSELPLTQHNLGTVYLTVGRPREAAASFEKALRYDPQSVDTLYALGVAYSDCGEMEKAVVNYEKAISIQPGMPNAHFNLATVLMAQAKYAEAAEHFRAVAALEPQSADARNNLAILLMASPQLSRQEGESLALARQAVELSSGNDPGILDTLAAAYAAAGQFDSAVQTAQEGLRLAMQQNQPTLIQRIQAKLPYYENRKPVPTVLSP